MAGYKGIRRRGGPGAASEEDGISSLVLVSGLDVTDVEAQGRSDSNTGQLPKAGWGSLLPIWLCSGLFPATPELRHLSCFF